MANEIVLVGNGMGALDNGLGEVIDSFPIVARFNWFWIEGYESDVGRKTDLWFTTIFCKKRMQAHDFRLIWCHSWAWGKGCKTFNLLRKAHPLVFKTQRATLMEMASFIGEPDMVPFSTGAIACWLMKDHFSQVHLHGFDWANGGAREKHHYGDKQVKGTIHKMDKEARFFEQMKNDGAIKTLE